MVGAEACVCLMVTLLPQTLAACPASMCRQKGPMHECTSAVQSPSLSVEKSGGTAGTTAARPPHA